MFRNQIKKPTVLSMGFLIWLPSVDDYRTFIDEFIAFLYAPEAEKLIADLAGCT